MLGHKVGSLVPTATTVLSWPSGSPEREEPSSGSWHAAQRLLLEPQPPRAVGQVQVQSYRGADGSGVCQIPAASGATIDSSSWSPWSPLTVDAHHSWEEFNVLEAAKILQEP